MILREVLELAPNQDEYHIKINDMSIRSPRANKCNVSYITTDIVALYVEDIITSYPTILTKNVVSIYGYNAEGYDGLEVTI